MSGGRRSSLRNYVCEVALVLAAILAVAAPAKAVDGDALSGPEYDREITLKVNDAPLFRVLRIVAQFGQVWFAPEFQEDPNLTVTLSATNMSLRALLTALATSHDLEYAQGTNGRLVVRRKNAPARGGLHSALIGPSKPGAGPLYELRFLARDPGGKVLSTPSVSTPLNNPFEVKQGVSKESGDAFIILKAVLERETADGLELSTEVTVERSASPVSPGETRIIQDRTKATRMAGKGETLLAKTENSYEIVLTSWTRIDPAGVVQPPSPEAAYKVGLLVRNAEGEVLARPFVTVALDRRAQLRLNFPATRTEETLGLTFTPRKETADTLELATELVVTRPAPSRSAGEVRHVEDHIEATKTIGKGETVLFKTESGSEIVVTSWMRVQQ